MSEIKLITGVGATELKDKRVMVRCDFNVQVFEGKILDDLRIKKTLPTIKYLREAGAKVILISHIESKDGTGLKPVCEYINATYSKECGYVTFVSDFEAPNMPNIMTHMKEGEVVLFENLRIDPREKSNDIEFVKLLASYADIYVNDAFAVSHRPHASVVGLPSLFPNARYAGIQLGSELSHLQVSFNAPHPFIFILGGAKFESKLPLIQKFSQADSIFLGGALLNDILKAKGYNVGKSLVSDGVDGSGALIDFAPIISNPKLVIPDDVVVSGPIEGGTIGTSVKLISEVGDEDVIMDVGPSMNEKLEEFLKSAKFVLWNGPMGNYEKGFKDQTIEMAKLVTSACRKTGVQVALGGGDTTAAIKELGFEDDDLNEGRLFVSTGGGAMLEYLENETLPGVDALK